MCVASSSRSMSVWERLMAERWLVVLCTVVGAVAFVNWSIYSAYSVAIGGDALGTVPAPDRFVVTSHGHETLVSERTWLISLFYTPATSLVFGIGFASFAFLIFRTTWLARVEREPDPLKRQRFERTLATLMTVFGWVLLLWTAGMLFGEALGFTRSLRAYLSL